MATNDSDYSKHYILINEVCPMPRTGPRVTVAFWAVDPVPPAGTRPELDEEPFFTITYPVGGGAQPFNWNHITDDVEDPLHPNSANHIEWVDGHLKIEQWTTFNCRPNLHTGGRNTLKNMHWELFQDIPPELFGRIVSVKGITDIVIKEMTTLRFTGVDGHFISMNRGETRVGCGARLLNEICWFKARFPDYIWDEHGGKGDEGAFFLQAANGCYLRSVVDADGVTRLEADAGDAKKATLFEATISGDGMVSLSTTTKEGKKMTLQHDPPDDDLRLVLRLERSSEEESEFNDTYAWFAADYA